MKLLLRFFGFLFAAGTILFVVGIGATAGLLWHFSKDLPDYSQLQDYEPPVMTRVHAADGSLVAEYARERRLYIPIQAVPRLVIHAFLAAEDKVFVWGRYTWTMRNSGVSDTTTWFHEITVRDGKIAEWRGHNDTAMLVAAYHGAPVRRAANG